MTTAARQAVLRSDMEVFMGAVAHQESMLDSVATACRAHLITDGAAATAPPACLFFSSLPQIPIRQWAGSHLYNNWFVRCQTPYALGPSAAAKPKAMRLHGAPMLKPSTASRALPKALVLPLDVEVELRKYWRLHDEAAARARLDALRCNDAEAFAKHVSLLKVSGLLKIMEKTEGFMRRIGLRLQAHSTQASANGGGDTTGAVTTTRVASAALDEQGDADRPGGAVGLRGSEYERFRAYVASTKNEFKLIHRVDVFVAAQPAGLDATLLPHQMDGLRFLASLDANHINGILADEMGVGKTVQTLAFLVYLKNRRIETAEGSGGRVAPPLAGPHLPHLVLAPLSVVREWQEACEQFVSGALRVAVYQELADPVREAAAYDLVFLPVHAARYVGAEAARVQWHYIVVDEAHKAVANLNTITAQCILSLPCSRRLVLTGTPLSSDLQELWSLLHFLNPEVFTDNDAFEEVFRRPFRVYEAREMELTEEERGLLILRLHQVLRPFLLRRTKADVDSTLRMTHHHIWCPLSAMQQRLLGMLREQRRTPTVLSMTGGHKSNNSSSSSSSEAGRDDEEEVAGAADEAPHTITLPAAEIGAAASAGCPGHTTAAASTAEAPHGKALPALDTLKAHNEASAASDRLTELVWQYLPALAYTEARDTVRCAVQEDRALGLTSAGVSELTSQLLCNHAFLLPFFSQVLHRHDLDEVTQEGYNNADSVAAVASQSCTLGAKVAGRCGAAGLTLACSGKFLILHLLLARLYVAQHKVVLFTHWLDCVDLLVDYLHSRGWADHTVVLTGGSSEAERLASVRHFREDPACLFFLISIKAGGCGINLQAAHMVVLVDRDYTATNEDQALARVYRIGQRHTVRAVYLATTDPSEERVAQRAATKNKPREAIINDGVYQVTTASEAKRAGETDESVTAAAFVEPPSHAENDLDACELWRSVPGVTTPPSPPPEAQETLRPACDGELQGAAGPAAIPLPQPESFWVALSRLIGSMDELVITEADRAAATVRSAEGASPDLGCAASNSVVARLFATRPPQSTAELQARLQREAERVPSTSPHSVGTSPSLSSAAAATPTWEQGEIRQRLWPLGCTRGPTRPTRVRRSPSLNNLTQRRRLPPLQILCETVPCFGWSTAIFSASLSAVLTSFPTPSVPLLVTMPRRTTQRSKCGVGSGAIVASQSVCGSPAWTCPTASARHAGQKRASMTIPRWRSATCASSMHVPARDGSEGERMLTESAAVRGVVPQSCWCHQL
ncbi:SNF2_family_N-terminal_domain/Helicase_conserved_C-terminal_domain_containing_protein [Leishmania braziliensis MHOM/BR/75/M2904]|uniref:SNF2_family_N-terminal_domain /Helicase_conserved_C-terminal_domain_containing_protein n=1 Tax=Leishmania braziliensis MHOM/BR/75/M2904 TaxID=420245 RepID=A0A3P3ZCK9_LEIBR|nr:SNF2_family_N-terminal_domain/Helicase_conserved_C-terminal_domain_containing_protein [Leishmania braziliensis MHOM/BR/75/M2904]